MSDDRRHTLAAYLIYGQDGVQAYVHRRGETVNTSRPVDTLADVLDALGAHTPGQPLHEKPDAEGHSPALELATQLAGVELGAYDRDVVHDLAADEQLGLAVAILLRRVREDAARVEREQLLAQVQRLGMKYVRGVGNEGRVYRLMWQDTLTLLSGGEED